MKVFVDQDSPITQLSRTPSGKFWTAFLSCIMGIFWFTSLVNYYADRELLQEDIDYVVHSTNKMTTMLFVWFCYHVVLILVIYPLHCIISQLGLKRLNAVMFISTGIIFMAFTAYCCVCLNFAIVCKFSLCMETCRLFLKVTSIGIETSKNVENNNNNQKSQQASLKHFVYYLFCPTAIYRPSYPMRKTRSYSAIINYVLILVSMIFLAMKASHYSARPLIAMVAEKPNKINLNYAWKTMQAAWLTGIFAAVGGIWFGFLHVWSNLWSEILLFGDRGFYKEWWTTNSSSDFMVSWNTVVQEWLREYIYETCKKHLGRKWAGPMVMLFSGFLHDYFVLVPASAFIPASIISMVLAVLIPTYFKTNNKRHQTKAENHDSNNKNSTSAIKSEKESSTLSYLSGSWSLFVIGISYWGYLGEYYARIVCPHKDVTLESLFMIRGLSCIE